MSDMQKIPFNLTALGVQNIPVQGTHFNIISSTGVVNVKLNTGGSLNGIGAGEGFAGKQFEILTVTDASGAPNNGFILIADDTYINQKIQGNVTVTQNAVVQSAGYSTTNATALSASSTTVLIPNGNRKKLIIQNRDANGNIFINFGTTATQANGLKIPPGGTFESDSVVCTGIIAIIGDIANNPNVLVLEG